MPGRVELLPVQNRDAVFRCGSISSPAAIRWMLKDLLYLDQVGVQDLILYRCALTLSNDLLSRSLNAHDAQGPGLVWGLAGKDG
ncbi:MAG: hypothetical protein LUQ02_00780 [Methanothrix sp.]|nr:hypothetical protein [Methanothrix sp.]